MDRQEGSRDSACGEPAARRPERVRLRHAWLFTWEGTSREVRELTDDRRLIAIVRGRWTLASVQELAEVLYRRNAGTAYDMAYLANRPQARFYSCVRTWNDGLYIGSIPHRMIYARCVSDLRIDKDEQSLTETVRWTEPASYKLHPFRYVQPEESQSLVRSSRALLAHDVRRPDA